jgi:hypothetical protein
MYHNDLVRNSFYQNLEAGEYVFKLKGLGKVIPIVIHKGDFWENENWILKKSCLFENSVA